ncbi:3'-5' exonuclease [Metarhizium album ARSEF 1941]|uniref:3'-5' exonuclease n=1 Tax=Metarhizium album (strain ARSEF 1941) TaxID=1081103 RepID=A0A0B2X6H7_METAS|nr:3'-5' exonuclease [Metarhizium album ARSEF 1941]KHO01075.1 3'-5' exonuclease [Metarhizium album ARSEF 1941]
MGTASSGESELIRLSLVDFFTGAVLIDSLVYPGVKMAHYNTRFSGVSKQTMEDSLRRRKCILGRDSARQAIYKFVGPDTVVIGHAGHQDLTSLRWIHHRIVDTLMIETRKRRLEEDMARRKEWEESASLDQQEGANSNFATQDKDSNTAVTNSQQGGLSLKALTLKRLNRVIQVKNRGHNSLEDALATRDLLHWHIDRTLKSSAEGLR